MVKIFTWFARIIWMAFGVFWSSVKLVLFVIGSSTAPEDAKSMLASLDLGPVVGFVADAKWWGLLIASLVLLCGLVLLEVKSYKSRKAHEVKIANDATLKEREKQAAQHAQLFWNWRKHEAPSQDGVNPDWVRVCLGAEIQNLGNKHFSKALLKVEVSDSNGWKFLSNDHRDFEIRAHESHQLYPLHELQVSRDRGEIRYKGGSVDEPRLLGVGQHLHILVEIIGDDPEDHFLAECEIRPFQFCMDTL